LLALYRSGRQADALATYRQARRKLVDELGLEPRRELHQLERAILRQDAALAAPPPAQKRDRQSILPAQPTSFLGRRRELDELVSLLTCEDVRLVTVT
jgi:DNA-binding SARP family transcriptional activator